MLKRIISLVLISLLTMGLFSSCKKKKKVYQGQDKNILKGWGEHIILPAYRYYQAATKDLSQAAQQFKAERSEANFVALQTKQVEAYKAFQEVLIFNFDYAEVAYLIPMANTFPTKVERSASDPEHSRTIGENIQLIKEGKASEIILKSTASPFQQAYQGLPALDYLLFDTEHNLAYYTGADGDSAVEYITMLTDFLSKNIDKVVKAWDDSRLKLYSNNDDGSSNGSYAQTINGFIKAYEKEIRAYKVGLAAGAIKAQQGKAAPQIIEAYYNGTIDKELLKLSLQASQNFFNGQKFHAKGKVKGLYDILVEHNNKKLADRINEQYALIYKELDALPLSLKETAVQQPEKMKSLYNTIQKNVAYYKTNMLAALNVVVGYVDTDGD